MTVRSDYVFIFTLVNLKTGLAFCTSKDLTVEQAKGYIRETLSEFKKVKITKLNFMGHLDYSEMEKGILNQLNMFEKYDPVWILNNN